MSKNYKLTFAAKYEFYILYLVFVKISAQQQDRTSCWRLLFLCRHNTSSAISRGSRIFDSQIIK
jgi:hypothetical protein